MNFDSEGKIHLYIGLPMEQSVSKCSNVDVDLESGLLLLDSNPSDEQLTTGFNSCYGLGSCDGSLPCDARVTVSIASDDVSMENVKLIVDDKAVAGQKNMEGFEKKSVKGKPKSMSAKKPPKPPRAPRGLSLDSADQMLIRELAELTRLKHARIERMKALMKMKEAKNSSFKNQLFATLLTILFFLVILFQGISPCNSAASIQGGCVFSILQSQNLSVSNA